MCALQADFYLAATTVYTMDHMPFNIDSMIENGGSELLLDQKSDAEMAELQREWSKCKELIDKMVPTGC